MNKIKLTVKSLKPSPASSYYDLILLQEEGSEALDISVGESEANALALAIDNLVTPRPTTYDFMKKFMDSFSIELKEATIEDFKDGIYYAKATFISGEKEINLDIRPSDAINMAIRANKPLFASNKVMEECAFVIDKYDDPIDHCCMKTYEGIDDMSIFGLTMLTDLLKDAIEKEDYITASLLRDKIKSIGKDAQC